EVYIHQKAHPHQRDPHSCLDPNGSSDLVEEKMKTSEENSMQKNRRSSSYYRLQDIHLFQRQLFDLFLRKQLTFSISQLA
ncbi:hypothetical protein CSUI_006972, partial [Cystoisospora suis]